MEVYVRHKCVNVEINRIECGREECAPSHSFGPGMRQWCLVHYVESGKGIFEINGITHKVSAGQIFYIPPRVITYYEADKDDPWTYRWLGVEGRNVEKLLENGGVNAENSVINADKEIFNIMGELLLNGEDEEKGLDVTALVYRFLCALGARVSESKVRSNGEIYVNKAQDYVHTYLHRKITVSEVSEYLNIDRSYLTALFKKELGISPQQYIMKVKIKTACEYLSSTNYDVSHIAQSVGYDDLFVFSHAFKRVKGISPTEFRKSLAK